MASLIGPENAAKTRMRTKTRTNPPIIPDRLIFRAMVFNHSSGVCFTERFRPGTDTVPARSSERSIHPSERIPPICSVRYYKVKVLPDEPNRHLVSEPKI